MPCTAFKVVKANNFFVIFVFCIVLTSVLGKHVTSSQAKMQKDESTQERPTGWAFRFSSGCICDAPAIQCADNYIMCTHDMSHDLKLPVEIYVYARDRVQRRGMSIFFQSILSILESKIMKVKKEGFNAITVNY